MAYCKVEKENVKPTVIELIPLLSPLHEGEANSTKKKNIYYTLPFIEVKV